MFTSRSEYRLTLRADNADLRLTGKGIKAGCIGSARRAHYEAKEKAIAVSRETLKGLTITPNEARQHGLVLNQDGIRRSAFDLLNYSLVELRTLAAIWPEMQAIDADVMEQLQVESLYASYLDRQYLDIESFKKEEGLRIPEGFDYDTMASLSNEVRAKLKHAAPETVGAAGRIPGITPAALSILIATLKKSGYKKSACA